MLVSGEIRWFWPSEPTGLGDWFRARQGNHPCDAGGGGDRIDEYLTDPAQSELGIKHRGKDPGSDVKGLVVRDWGQCEVKPFTGTIELWTKWSSKTLRIPSELVVVTTKTRWLRKFDTSRLPPIEISLDDSEQPINKQRPIYGCNVEFTKVTTPGEADWWTFGFEAFGTIETVTQSLVAAATELSTRRPAGLQGGTPNSYASWLMNRKPVVAKAGK